MSGQPIYLCYPSARTNPLCAQWVSDICTVFTGSVEWASWSLRLWQCDDSCGLQVNDVASAVIGDIGPVVVVRPVQESVFVNLRERLYARAVVVVGDVSDSADILGLLEQARTAHLGGEPMLPRKLVVALALIGKLNRNNRWGGHNRKGFMWGDDLKNGKGFPIEFADQLPEVLGDLISARLVQKKHSQSANKYALNRAEQHAIYAALRTWRFPESVDRILRRDTRLESARSLDKLAVDS